MESGDGWEAMKQTATRVCKELIEKVGRAALANRAGGQDLRCGGGGFMMFLCTPQHRPNLCRALMEVGGSVLNFHFTQQGAMSWQVP